jgi:methionyl-tRNA synthetase
MQERILIGVAWPYANGSIHIGHIAGAYLPADIFARYHRLKGNHVLMVSGSDQHGTPITIRAEQEGITPEELVAKYHAEFIEIWERLGISWDCYTTTGTENHREVVHDVFTTLYQRGFIRAETRSHPYCEKDHRFLPDRYVEGTCPNCKYPLARGDQCEKCGQPRDPEELIEWRCRICGTPPILRDSEHFFLRLSILRDALIPWVKQADDRWRANVYRFTLNWITEELKDRPITRDIDWGVPVPLDGYEDKRIYVWFEAVIGYLSASIEWAKRRQQPDEWRQFWQDPACKSYYFIGKDNIAFHAIIWPAMLMAYGSYDPETEQGEYNLPYDIPSNEFLTLQGNKISTSQNWAVWVSDYLERFEPDPLRFYFSANMPESGDADFSWAEFVRRNNDELVATYGNLVHRVLTLIARYFGGLVPEPRSLTNQDTALMHRATETLSAVSDSLAKCRFREAVTTAMKLAAETNRYLDRKAPWHEVKEDTSLAANTLWTALNSISTLKTVLAPFLPFSSKTLHTMAGFPGNIEDIGWQIQAPHPGQVISNPAPLFSKLDYDVVEREEQLLAKRTNR